MIGERAMSKVSVICLIVWIIGLIISYFTIRFSWIYKRQESGLIKSLTSDDDCIVMIIILLLPVINIIVCLFLELFTYIPTHIDDAIMDKLFLNKNKNKERDKDVNK